MLGLMSNTSISIAKQDIQNRIKRNDGNEDWENRLIDWCTYYRRNIHRFIEHYFGIKLFPYQILWIYYMSISDSFITIASRASAKSWLIAVYACAIAVLYPHSEIVVVSSTQKQAGIIIQKIEKLKDEYENLNREIHRCYDSSNKRECSFYNTSVIRVVSCSEGARGHRSNLTIGEEFIIMDKDKYDSIIRPFAFPRQVPYAKLDKWKNLPAEKFKQILISSAGHKGAWWYTITADTIKRLTLGENVGFIAFDYLLAIEHNMKTLDIIREDKKGMTLVAFQEEYCNLPWGENGDAYFKLEMFERARTVKKAFYPQRNENYNPKKNPYDIKKKDGEIRVISVDVATRKGSGNDLTVISLGRNFPTSDGYIRELSYMESHSGENIIIQALRIKQLFHDFDCDYVVLDVQQAGIVLYEALGVVTKDEERDKTYPAWTIMYTNDLKDKTYEELKEKTLASDALEIIYTISATSKFNNDIAVDFRDKLQKRMFNFLLNEPDAEAYLLASNAEYLNFTDDASEKSWYLHPYVQTSCLISECIGLSLTLNEGLIKLKESSTGRKDRYTSVAYMNYFISTVLDPKVRRLSGEEDSAEDIVNCVFW
jgi:hypothetical protein